MDHPDISEIEIPALEGDLSQLEVAPNPGAVDVVQMSRKLPENDGMTEMRRRIQTIQSSSTTYDQKRYLMQQVLTENYTILRHAKAVAEGKFESSVPTKEVPLASSSRDSGFGATALETLKSWTGLEEKTIILASKEDACPTYVPQGQSVLDDEDVEDIELDDEDFTPQLGCMHYKRNVRIQCADCEKWYTCRLCHDSVEDHTLRRRLTRHMLCMLCGHPQKASDTCVNCGESAAQYYCNICKLWSDDVNKPIYHCDECGICRVGHGLDKDFFHCKVRFTLSLSLSPAPCKYVNLPFRPAAHASPYQPTTITSALNQQQTRTVQYVENTCFPHPRQSFSWSAATLSIAAVSLST